MTSINELELALKGLDPKGALAGVAYAKVFNASLGFHNETGHFDFAGFLPWGSWKNFNRDSHPAHSVLEQCVVQTLEYGLLAVKNACYIDIVHLGSINEGFMTEKTTDKPESSILDTIVKHCQRLKTEQPNVIPYIRFLGGGAHDVNAEWKTKQTSVLKSIFWPDGNPIFKGTNAKLLFGIYTPSFVDKTPSYKDRAKMIAEVSAWLGILAQKITADIPKIVAVFGEESKSSLNTVMSFVTAVMLGTLVLWLGKSTELPALGWLHAKFVAVNGKALLTGGGNFSWDYTTQNQASIFDFAVKIAGDASITAHNYADYLWNYLAKPHLTDDSSYALAANLSGSCPENFTVITKPDDLKDVICRFKSTPLTKNGISSLSVGKVGFWHGGELDYPEQILDLFRDMVLQTAQVLNKEFFPKFSFMPMLVETLSDQNLLEGATRIGTSPAAWASKSSRLHAIESATTCIHMGQQSLVNFLMLGDKSYTDMVDKYNLALRMPLVFGVQKNFWDGMLWPYDLLVAFAKALSRIAKLPKGDSESADGPAIYIVLSAQNSDWGDPIPLAEVSARLKEIMYSMASHNLLPEKTAPADVAKIIEERFLLRRALCAPAHKKSDITPPTNTYHGKIVCVDRKLLYVGSDNAYSNYNEEYGCWIEQKENVESFITDYYKQLWKESGWVNQIYKGKKPPK